jgi:EAL domain-containing protein (putative c-di-GMP-specific phosphodiesterase class I)
MRSIPRLVVNCSPLTIEFAGEKYLEMIRYSEMQLFGVEITEHRLLEIDAIRLERFVQRARDDGLAVILDDIHELHRVPTHLPADFFKVGVKSDRFDALLRDLDEKNIIAEQVETEHDLTKAKRAQCAGAQGFLLHRPVFVEG